MLFHKPESELSEPTPEKIRELADELYDRLNVAADLTKKMKDLDWEITLSLYSIEYDNDKYETIEEALTALLPHDIIREDFDFADDDCGCDNDLENKQS